MPSTYTLNNGIELISTGEQSGTWGDTTNTNLSLVDAALDGQVTVTLSSAGSSGSPNALPISDGATSNGRNRVVIFNDGSDLGATAYVQLTPNDAEKIIYVRNSLSGSRSIILFQGTYSASNDYEVPAGTTAVVFFDGAGSGAVAANVFNNAYFDSLRLGSVSVTAILDEDNMSSNSATALATQQSIKAYVDTQVGANNELSEVLANGNTTGSNNIVVNNGQAITTNTVNETTSGSGVTIDSVLLKDDGVNATNLEVTNLKANDGTAAGSIANSTGAFTITSLISNSVDIGGGAIDGTVIGGSTPAAISGTTGSFSSHVTLGDNDELRFGDSDDLTIKHNATNGVITNNTNHLYLANTADDKDVYIQTDDGSGGITNYFLADGSTGEAKMYYYGSAKITTQSYGAHISGALTLSAADPYIKLTDTSTGADHEIDANSGVGNLVINADINAEGSEPKLLLKVTGTTGITVRDTGNVDIAGDLGVGGNVDLPDNGELRFGDSNDFILEHNGSNGDIRNNTNDLLIRNLADDRDVNIQSDNGSGGTATYFKADGSSGEAQLFHYGSEKLNTTSSGVTITGALSKSSGSFKIDHPLKPETHHLVHSFVEAPQADNIYRGKVALVNGSATVNLDDAGRMTEGTFVALNGNIQCFTSNEDGWTALRGSVSGNTLTVEAQDASCTDTVSWLVIGERHDPHMLDTDWTDEAGRVITEPEKHAEEEE
jgi:hypothetical protein